MTQRLTTTPDEGRVLLAHPSCEALARRHAEANEVDYLLTDLMPTDRTYLLDVDACETMLGDVRTVSGWATEGTP